MMAETLFYPRRIPIRSVLIALWLIALVWGCFHFMGDPIQSMAMAMSIGILPLLIGNRPLLLFATLFSFYAAQTFVPELLVFFSQSRWYFLGACVVIALVRPLLVRRQSSTPWKASKWIWIFVIVALLSAIYSVSPKLTILRLISISSVFFLGAQFVKPLAESYGVKKVTDLILYAIFPFYLVSILIVGSHWAYVYPGELTYEQLNEREIYQKVTGIAQPLAPNRRFHGLFQNPNNIGLLTGMLFPIVLVKVLQRGGRKTIPLLLLLLMLFSLGLSASREGLAMCMVSSFYVVGRLYGAKKIIRFLFVLLPTGALLSPLLLAIIPAGWLSAYLRLGTNLMMGGGRVEAWLAASGIIAMKPLLGYGFGTENLLFERFKVRFHMHEGTYAHNSYLGMGMQLGLVGTLLLFVPLFYLLISELRSENPSPIRVALQGTLMAGLAGCMTESWIYAAGNSQALSFWVCVALLEYLRDTEDRAAHGDTSGSVPKLGTLPEVSP